VETKKGLYIYKNKNKQKQNIMIQEINKGIERALQTINYELSFGDLANQERIAKYNKYIADMNELKATL